MGADQSRNQIVAPLDHRRHPKSRIAPSVTIAGLLCMVWLAVVRPEGFVVNPVEMAYIAFATVLISAAMASYVHRGWSARL